MWSSFSIAALLLVSAASSANAQGGVVTTVLQCQKGQLCGPNNKCLPLDPAAKNPTTQPYICAQDPCLTVSCPGNGCCESTLNSAAGRYTGYTCVNPCALAKCMSPFVCINQKDPQTGKCGANCMHPCADPDKNPCGPGESCLPVTVDPTATPPVYVPGKYQCVNPCLDPASPNPCKDNCCRPVSTGATFPSAQFTPKCLDPCQAWPCPNGQNCIKLVDNVKHVCERKCADPCLDPGLGCPDPECCTSARNDNGAFPPWMPSCVNPCAGVDCKPPFKCKTIKDKWGRCVGAQCVAPCEPNPCGKYENCEYVLSADGTYVQDPVTGEAMYSCVNPCTKKPCPWWPKHTCCKPVWDPTNNKWLRSCTNPCSPPAPLPPPKCKWPKPFCQPVIDPVTHMCRGTTCVGFPCWDSPCGLGSTCLDLATPLHFMAAVMGKDPAAATDPNAIDPSALQLLPDDDCDGIADTIYTCPTCGAGYVPIQVPALPPGAGTEQVPLDTPLSDDAGGGVVGVIGSGDVAKLDDQQQVVVRQQVVLDGGGELLGIMQMETCMAPVMKQLVESGGEVVDGGGQMQMPPVQRCVPGVEACKAQNLCGRNSAAACAPAPPLDTLLDPGAIKELQAAGATGLQEVLELKAGFICNINPCETIRCAPPNCCVPKTNKWGLYTGFSCVNPCDNALCKKPLHCRAEQDKIGQCIGSCCVNPCANKPCPKGTICKPRFDDFGVIQDQYDCVSAAPPNPCTDPSTAISCANNGCCKPAFVNFQWVATCDFPCVGPFATCLDSSAVCKPNMDKYGVCLGGWHCEVIPF